MWCFLFVLLFLTLVLYSVVYLDVTTYVAYYVFISKQNVIVPEKNENYEFKIRVSAKSYWNVKTFHSLRIWKLCFSKISI